MWWHSCSCCLLFPTESYCCSWCWCGCSFYGVSCTCSLPGFILHSAFVPLDIPSAPIAASRFVYLRFYTVCKRRLHTQFCLLSAKITLRMFCRMSIDCYEQPLHIAVLVFALPPRLRQQRVHMCDSPHDLIVIRISTITTAAQAATENWIEIIEFPWNQMKSNAKQVKSCSRCIQLRDFGGFRFSLYFSANAEIFRGLPWEQPFVLSTFIWN